ncbi:MAG: hypothetical protein OXE94_14875 [Aestuariivita sp.]|nr:hypothetical protein [Aestuariivita sp.]
MPAAQPRGGGNGQLTFASQPVALSPDIPPDVGRIAGLSLQRVTTSEQLALLNTLLRRSIHEARFCMWGVRSNI